MKSVRVTMSVATGWARRRSIDAHKGSSGRVLVVAGSRGMVGAAVLAATSAVRSGAGLVRLATVASQQRAAVIRAPLEITTQALSESKDGRISNAGVTELKRVIKDFKPDVVAVGPGLGVTPAIKRLVQFLMVESHQRVVLDADGLNALAALPRRRFSASAILTPHAGEAARLLKTTSSAVLANRASAAQKIARQFGCVCVLKGPGTLIADASRIYENTTGNPAMASGGMGDVLTGLIASTWAQRLEADLSALTSAAFGVFLHGLCADIAVRSFPERTLLASDLIEVLPAAYKKIWRNI